MQELIITEIPEVIQEETVRLQQLETKVVLQKDFLQVLDFIINLKILKGRW